LQLIPPNKGVNPTYEALTINAPDSETIQFVSQVIVDGPVELWLVEVENDDAKLEKFRTVRIRRTVKKGKVKNWQGQLLITVGKLDEQKKAVEAESEKIAKEAAECDKIAADAQADLDVALPALERAMAEVDKLGKNSITELKSFTNPPKLVETVLTAVMTPLENRRI
jgi:dynein heavy chain